MVELCCEVLLLLSLLAVAHSSTGDASYAYQRCAKSCEQTSCASSAAEAYIASQPFYERWLLWDCRSDCAYDCMWTAVKAFHKDGLPTPQFFGKWPFLRLFGIQEPASTVFSLANALAHIWLIRKFRAVVSKRVPMYYVWHAYFLVALNAWVWSTLFHARDFPVTEKMDYFSATLLVVYQLYALVARYLVGHNRLLTGAAGVGMLLLCSHHVYYLSVVHFDYGYHVRVSVSVGLINSLGWLMWCYSNWQQDRRYVWKCAVSIVLTVSLALLEVLDFSPLAWTLDAHSLWHGGTAPLTFLWYSFLIDDCVNLTHDKRRSSAKEA